MQGRNRRAAMVWLCILPAIFALLCGCGSHMKSTGTALFSRLGGDMTARQVQRLLGAPDAEADGRYTYYKIDFFDLAGSLDILFDTNGSVASAVWQFQPIAINSIQNYAENFQDIYDHYFDAYGPPEETARGSYVWNLPGVTYTYSISGADNFMRFTALCS